MHRPVVFDKPRVVASHEKRVVSPILVPLMQNTSIQFATLELEWKLDWKSMRFIHRE